MDRKLTERFMSFVRENGECWEWTGFKNRGYGMFCVKNKQLRAHRISYTIFVGEIPKTMVIDHLCKNKDCVNPKHLEAVTNEENVRRAQKGVPKHVPDGFFYNDTDGKIYPNSFGTIVWEREMNARFDRLQNRKSS